MYRYFKRIVGAGSGNYIYFWKSKVLCDERIDSMTASNYNITSELSHYGTKVRVKFSGSCLKQYKTTYNHIIKNSQYIHCLHEISKNYNISSYQTFYLELSIWLKMLILISINILDMALDLIEKDSFHLVMDLEEILFYCVWC